MNQRISMGLELDTLAIQKEAQKKLIERARDNMEWKLNILFHNPRDQQALKYRPTSFEKDPDLSVCYKHIDAIIVEKALGPEFHEYAQKYINHHWQRVMDEALESAMKHHANAIAFKQVKLHAPRGDKEKENGIPT